ncbi:hypothetical protein ABZ734_08660 [Streptomyces sp. NPDC006660]|uniref:hypothetical protein n=1 Tax=Streptomyces sp. NPDC006660 TaxID=3156901 RepID=UPI0033CE7566
MVLIAVFLPILLLMAVLGLGRYEEFLLGGDEPAEAPRGRHLAAVPDLAEDEASEPDTRRVSEDLPGQRRAA